MSTPLALPRELTIYTVGELHPQWLGWLADRRTDGKTGACVVDATAVDEVDAAGVQLLLSLAHALQNDQRPLRLRRPSAALTTACQALGLAALLADAPQGAAA